MAERLLIGFFVLATLAVIVGVTFAPTSRCP